MAYSARWSPAVRRAVQAARRAREKHQDPLDPEDIARRRREAREMDEPLWLTEAEWRDMLREVGQ